jgi:NADH-quinone oxidoreductase subunit L
MTIPLIILAVLAVLGGLLNSPRLNGEEVVPFTLTLEHWLEESLVSMELEEEGVIEHVPHTPTSIDFGVAATSLVLAVGGMLLAVFVVYRKSPESATDKDPTQRIPGLWGGFGRLPVDSLYMKLLIPGFNRFAWWLSQKFEWKFWHDFIHENIIRDTFVWFANLIDMLDKQGVDGLVNGLGSATKWLADGIRISQTGYARTYALSVFLGAVALLLYFLWPYLMN